MTLVPITLALCVLGLIPQTAALEAQAVQGAQTIHGVVYLAESDTVIEGATVQLVGPDGIAQPIVVTGQDGAFTIEAPEVGRYTLRVRSIGYRPQYVAIALDGGQAIALRVNLARQVTLLEGVTIFGETAETPEQREFLSRRNLAWGTSWNREEIGWIRAGNVRDLLRRGFPLMLRKPCVRLFVDGSQSYGWNIPAEWLYGIEVYMGYRDTPIKYRDNSREFRPCATVLLWSTTVESERK